MRLIPFLILTLFNLAFGLILHPNGEPPQEWTDHPSDAITATVGFCSGTVIHPHYVITAAHCNVGMSTPITVDEQVYFPNAIYTHPTRDVSLVKVLDAHFTEFAVVHEIEPELEDKSLEIVIGGWGKRRGNTVFAETDQYMPVGYTWGNHSGRLKWGTSKLYGYSTAGIYTKFEMVNDPNGTPYECALATYDSGCGMYSQTDENWQLIGIGRKTGDTGYAYYRNPIEPSESYGTLNVFLRIDPYVGWIHSIIYGADINNDGWINTGDMEQFYDEWLSSEPIYFYRSDLNRDGVVDLADITQIASQWNTVVAPADITGNGRVDSEDLYIFLSQWLNTESNPSCDFDNSGKVDIADFSILAQYW